MPRVELQILRRQHRPSLAIGYPLDAVRLMAETSLRAATGWTKFAPIIVDTGAPLSLFPPEIWHAASHRPIGRIRLGGIVGRPECQIETVLAEVDCVISDGRTDLGPFTIHACLAESVQVPTLLGISGVLDALRLVVDLRAAQAYLESP